MYQKCIVLSHGGQRSNQGKLGENWMNQEPGGHRFILGNRFKYQSIARRLIFNSNIYLLYQKCTVGLIITVIVD